MNIAIMCIGLLGALCIVMGIAVTVQRIKKNRVQVAPQTQKIPCTNTFVLMLIPSSLHRYLWCLCIF